MILLIINKQYAIHMDICTCKYAPMCIIIYIGMYICTNVVPNNIYHHTTYIYIIYIYIGRRGVRQLAHSTGKSTLFNGEGQCPFPP